MIRLYIILILSLFINFRHLCAQSDAQNLQKYWDYRERLRNKFILVTSDVEQNGVNLPAAHRNYSTNTLEWDDANGLFPHYLGVLATEYRLLKNNGQDYKQTLNELFYAMYALERMDYYSEYFIRVNNGLKDNNGNIGWTQPSDFNGFYIRDDINETFWKNNASYFKMQNFYSQFRDQSEKGISQDNKFHLMEGLALITALLDDEYMPDVPINYDLENIPDRLRTNGILYNGDSWVSFKKWAQDFTFRSIKNMQHPDPEQTINFIFKSIPTSLQSRWYIRNPVLGQLTEEGSGSDFDTYYFYGYGAACAGKWITGKDLQFDNSDNKDGIFRDLLMGEVDAAWAQIDIRIPKKYDNYKLRSLATVGDIKTSSGAPILWVLLNSAQYTYEHFPLLYMLLHGKGNADLNTTFNSFNIGTTNLVDWYRNLLNKAPCGGPTSKVASPTGDYEWSSPSRLVWPEDRAKEVTFNVEYAGVDYMLLYNLFCLQYQLDYRKINISINAPILYQSLNQQAINIIAKNQIKGGTVIYTATKSIKLAPGFTTSVNGTTFTAKIAGVSPVQYDNLTTCTTTQPFRLGSFNRVSSSTNDENKEVKINSGNIDVFPNPTIDYLNIKVRDQSEISLVTIIDIKGQTVLKLESIKEPIYLGDLPKGLYLLKVNLINNYSFSRKIMLQ